MRKVITRILAVLMAAIILQVYLAAQVKGGNISGQIVQEDGSILPGIVVTLTGEKIGIRNSITTAAGNFRFICLPPGIYDLSCDIPGCDCSQKGIRVHPGETVRVSVTCRSGGSALVRLIRSRQFFVGLNMDEEFIQSIPTARNPWTLVTTVPGVMTDRSDIGGVDSGQQSNIIGMGSDKADTTWYIDGVTITDPSSVGAAAAYLNANIYQEIQVITSATDITAQTGGIQLNFLNKSGGNRVSGDFHLYVEDSAWEMKQTPTDYMKSLGFVVPGINRLHQYGAGIGGPIVKDKLHWFCSYSIQDIHKRTEANLEDASWLLSVYGKVNFHLGNTSGDFNFSLNNKKKWGRTTLSPSQQDNGSLWDQDGPGYFLYGNISHVFGDLMLNLKAAYTDGGFHLKPRGAQVNPDNGHSEGAEFKIIDGWSRIEGSNYDYQTNRNSLDLALDGSYFLESVLGGDHEIRFGVDYFTSDTTTLSMAPNQRIAYVYRDNPSWNYLAIQPDYVIDVGFKRISAYVQDTITWGKLTASVGVRYDREQGKVNPFTQPYFTWYEPGSPHHGERMFANIIDALEVKGFNDIPAWKLLSPRISLTYDITGDGKNVVKVAAARYMSQCSNAVASNYIPFRYGWAHWTDANGDEIPQYSEVGDLFFSTLFTQVNPVTGMKIVQYDPEYNSPFLDELTLMFEKTLTDDLSLSLTGFYKKRQNLSSDVNSRGEAVNVSKGIMANGNIETKNNYEYIGTTTVGGTEVPTYARIENPVGTYYYNLDKAYDRYLGLQFQVVKKLSHRWMANLSFTLQDWKRFRFEEETLDMNNFDFFNEGVVAPATTGSGLRDIWVNSSWMIKLTGMYRLPWGINLTGFFQAREGYPQPLRRRVTLSQGAIYLYRAGHKAGDERLPTFWLLNLGLEKIFQVSDTVSAALVIDWYNATNKQINLKHNLNIGTAAVTAPTPTMWTNPGIFQFGIRLNF